MSLIFYILYLYISVFQLHCSFCMQEYLVLQSLFCLCVTNYMSVDISNEHLGNSKHHPGRFSVKEWSNKELIKSSFFATSNLWITQKLCVINVFHEYTPLTRPSLRRKARFESSNLLFEVGISFHLGKRCILIQSGKRSFRSL